jgi:hypothetical protein
MFGDHAIYHDGWMASTKVIRPPWVNFAQGEQGSGRFSVMSYSALRRNWMQTDKVADKYPDKVKEICWPRSSCCGRRPQAPPMLRSGAQVWSMP